MKKYAFILIAGLMPFFVFANNFSLPNLTYADLLKGKTQIAVVVNEEAITYQQVVDRVKMVAFMSGMKENQETYSHVTNQVVRALVDESLRAQEMKANGIPFEIEAYDAELKNVAAAKNMNIAQLKAAFAKKNIPFTTLETQIIVFSGWLELARAKYGRDLSVSDAEVRDARNQYILNAGKPEYLLAEIFLSSNGYKSDYDLEQEGYRLLEELKKGADFVSLARQFSDGAGAQRGGDMGWVLQGQLSPSLDDALEHLAPGTISVPIQDPSGYHLLLLRDKRMTPSLNADEIVLDYLKVTMPFDSGKDDYDDMSAKMDKYRARMTSCAVAQKIGRKEKAISVIKQEGQKLSTLPDIAEAEIAVLPDGKASLLMMEDDQLAFYMVCARDSTSLEIPTMDQVDNYLRRQRLDMFQKRMFRDIFQASYVDVKY